MKTKQNPTKTTIMEDKRVKRIRYRIVAGTNTCTFMRDPLSPRLQGHVFLSETSFIFHQILNKTSVKRTFPFMRGNKNLSDCS